MSDPTQEHLKILPLFNLRDYYPLWWSFPGSFNYKDKLYVRVLQPSDVNIGVWATPCSLATTKGISFDFFSLATKMFQFAKYPLPNLCIQLGVPDHNIGGVHPFGNLRVNACITARRSLSQFTTSFIGTKCQGIHYMPLCNLISNLMNELTSN